MPWNKWQLPALSKMQLTFVQLSFEQCTAVSNRLDQNALDKVIIARSQ